MASPVPRRYPACFRRRSSSRARLPDPGRHRCRSRLLPRPLSGPLEGARELPRMRVPDAPSGWPMAIAPPCWFTTDGSMSHARTQASDCAANASFTRRPRPRSTDPGTQPPLAASTGAIPKNRGSLAAAPHPRPGPADPPQSPGTAACPAGGGGAAFSARRCRPSTGSSGAGTLEPALPAVRAWVLVDRLVAAQADAWDGHDLGIVEAAVPGRRSRPVGAERELVLVHRPHPHARAAARGLAQGDVPRPGSGLTKAPA